MLRVVFILLTGSLTLATGCGKKGSSSEGSGSGVASSAAMVGSETTGSGAAGSSAMAATGSGAAAAGSGAESGSAAAAAGSGAVAATGSGAAAAGSGAESGSAAAAVGSGGGSGSGAAAAEQMAHRAGMCPSTVLGATTKSAMKGKAVVVTIESTDKAAIAAIQKRTDELLAEKKHARPGNGHDMKGTHGGGQGLCPVFVPEGAKATGKHEAKGVVVTITPKDKPDELAKEVEGRIAKAEDWVKANLKGDKQNQGGIGGGKGEDGMNHSGKGDGKGHERKQGGGGGGGGGGKGTGGGGGAGTGGGSSKAS